MRNSGTPTAGGESPPNSLTAGTPPQGAVQPESSPQGSSAPFTTPLSGYDVPERAAWAAHSENLPEDVWIALASDPSPRVRRLVRGNMHAPDSAKVLTHLLDG